MAGLPFVYLIVLFFVQTRKMFVPFQFPVLRKTDSGFGGHFVKLQTDCHSTYLINSVGILRGKTFHLYNMGQYMVGGN